MTKRTSAAGSASAPPKVTPPRSIDLLGGAMVLTALAMLAQGLATLGSSATFGKILHDNIVKSNKGKVPKDIAAQVTSQLHNFRVSGIVQGLLFVGVLGLLAYMLRRPRTASGARWATLIVLVLTRAPFNVVPQSGLPAAYEAATVLVGIAALATLVLLFVPSSAAYFRACRAATMPAGATARPGLSGLFGGRRPPRPAPATAPVTTSAATSKAPSRAKAKVRADAEAIARGAELARTRAKATKSRRSEA
jgi:cytochrome c oxidase subunit IV